MSIARILSPYPALLLDSKERYIVISDLHIGFEERYKGLALDGEYIKEIIEVMNAIAKSTKPRAFIILGDLKDSIGRISKSEWEYIPKFLEMAKEISQIIIVPGNHDNNIKRLIPRDVQLVSSRGLIIDDTLLLHGHTFRKYQGFKRVIMGHLHPRFIKYGSVLNGERVWIYGKKGMLEIIIMPTFNKYITNEKGHELVRNLIEMDKCLIIKLDGSIIGDESMLDHILI